MTHPARWSLAFASLALIGCPSALVGGRCAEGWVERGSPPRCVREDAATDVPDPSDASEDGARDAGPVPEDGRAGEGGAGEGGAGEGGAPCEAPFVLCDGRCVNLADDRNHCGMCSRPCEVGEFCVFRECLPGCAAPLVQCGARCVDLNSDPENCGACDNRCLTGVCNAGRCRTARAGHIVLLGHDYQESRSSQDTLLVNSVLLAARTNVRLLTFGRYADPFVRARVDALIDAALGAANVRRTAVMTEDALSRELSIDRFDGLLVYDQRTATEAQMSQLATQWSDPLVGFARAGGTVILLDGAEPAVGNWRIARETGLLAIDGAEDADQSTVRLLPSAAADAVASRADLLYSASRHTVQYRPASPFSVFVSDLDGTSPVVLHRAVLP
jgi:hypothetical protein